MLLLFYCFMVGIELVKMILFNYNFVGISLTMTTRKVLLLLFSLIIGLVFLLFTKNNDVTILVVSLLPYFFFLLLFSKRTLKTVFLSIFILFTISILDSIYASIIMHIFDLHILTAAIDNTILSQLVDNVLVNSIQLVLLFAIGIVMTCKGGKNGSILNIRASDYKLLFFIVLSLFGIGILTSPILIDMTQKWSMSAIIVISFDLLLLILLSILFMYSLSRQNDYQAKIAIGQKLIQNQKHYYQQLMNKETKMRKFKHDITNHFFVLNRLMETKQYQRSEDYLKQLSNSYSKMNQNRLTNNDLFNIIIDDVESNYGKQKNKIEVNGIFPANLVIEDIDFCILFSNLLRNAYEALIKANNEKSKIVVKVKVNEKDLFLRISNPSEAPVKILNGKLISNKTEADHGLGSQNVKEIVAKYGGTIQYLNEDNDFVVELLLLNCIKG